MMQCPKCKIDTPCLYRDKPKGEKAKFVCIDCVPGELKPKQDVIDNAKAIDAMLRKSNRR